MTPLADQKVYVIAVVYAEEKEKAETSVIKATAVVSDTWKWQMKIPIKELPQNSKLLWNELSCLSLDECVSDSVFDRSLPIKRKLKVVYWRKEVLLQDKSNVPFGSQIGAFTMLNGVSVVCSRLSDNGDGNGHRMTNINRDGVNHRRPLSDTQQVQAFVQHFSLVAYILRCQ